MLKLNNPNCLPIKDMTSIEVALLLYLIEEDVCQHHIIKVSFSDFYLTMFGEIYKSGSSRKMQLEFNNAIEHYKELGLISIVLDSHNCKVVNTTSLFEENAAPFVLIDDEYYKIFKELDLAKHIQLKIFKLYVYLLTTIYKNPELNGKAYNDYNLGFLSAKQLCDNIGLTYNTYSKYIECLEELELIYVNRDGGFINNKDNGIIRTPNIYCRFKDKGKADSYISAKKSKSNSKKKEDTSEDAYYEDMYAKVVNGNSDYTVDELRNCVRYIFGKDNNRDLAPLKTLVRTKETEGVSTEVEEDDELPF